MNATKLEFQVGNPAGVIAQLVAFIPPLSLVRERGFFPSEIRENYEYYIAHINR